MDYLSALPCEVIEHIAVSIAEDCFLGPPSGLLPLLHLNRRTHSFLAFDSNPHLYSRIFSVKFDTQSAHTHFGLNRLSATALASELKRRCIYLKRIRDQLDCVDSNVALVATPTKDPEHIEPVLWTAYLMMVENDGKNEAQLKNYAKIHKWIQDYWFNRGGTSFASVKLNADLWPKTADITAAGMWLLWLFFRPEDYIKNRDMTLHVMNILKLFALGAHRYSLSNIPWINFSPTEPTTTSNERSNFIAYGENITLTPLPVGIPAILAYLSLYIRIRTPYSSNSLSSYVVTASRDHQPLRIRDCVWEKCRVVPKAEINFPTMFKSGSMDGVWEGMFTYVEFTAYTELLQGGPPSILSRSLIPRHQQTWKIREHILLSSEDNEPLPPGDPLRAFIPDNATITETSDGTRVEQGANSTQYTRFINLGDSSHPTTKDIIITGEGHSAWGQFKLLGRVRPCDGFVILIKEYLEEARAHWLYRGYIVGDNFVGRWRDTISPIQLHGYEGCFVMSRRK